MPDTEDIHTFVKRKKKQMEKLVDTYVTPDAREQCLKRTILKAVPEEYRQLANELRAIKNGTSEHFIDRISDMALSNNYSGATEAQGKIYKLQAQVSKLTAKVNGKTATPKAAKCKHCKVETHTTAQCWYASTKGTKGGKGTKGTGKGSKGHGKGGKGDKPKTAKWCNRCNKGYHDPIDCMVAADKIPKFKNRQDKVKKALKAKIRAKQARIKATHTCKNCGEVGHTKANCPELNSD
jgi:hypothetical protein